MPAQPWPALLEAIGPQLPAGRRTALVRLREPADRSASLLGIALLIAALRARLPAMTLAGLEYPPRGKPRLPAGPDFSIAHAAGIVLCAVASRGRVGVDVEAPRAVSAAQLRLALGPAELARVAGGGLDATAAWVMTEATLKAVGAGIDASRRVRLGEATASLDGQRLHLRPVALPGAPLVWVAHELGAVSIEVVAHEPAAFAPLP